MEYFGCASRKNFKCRAGFPIDGSCTPSLTAR